MKHITTSPDRSGDGYLKSGNVHVPDARPYGVKTSLLVIPAGQEARQEFQGPMVPGPWGCTIQHGVVIDNLAGERNERAAAQQIMLGEPVTVDGLPGIWCFAERDRRRLQGDGVRLIPHGADPDKVGYHARPEDQPAENLLVPADPETDHSAADLREALNQLLGPVMTAETKTRPKPQARPEVMLLFCPVCGRDDRYVNMRETRRHYDRGSLCSGQLIRLTYRLVDDAETQS